MKFFKYIFLIFLFFIFSACEDLSFIDEDFVSLETNSVQEAVIPKTGNKEILNKEENKEAVSKEETTVLSEDLELSENLVIQIQEAVIPKTDNKEILNKEENKEAVSKEETTVLSEDLELSENLVIQIQEAVIPKTDNKEILNKEENKEAVSKEETTVLSEDLELSENLVIQNRKVVLDMVTIQTLQYDLTVLAEEFVSNHSFIRNFPEGQTANERENGKSGGHVLIKAKTAKGSLGLILSGENGGYVPKRTLSRRERENLSGLSGENGYDAVYDTWCRDIYIPLGLWIVPANIVIDKDCWQECRINPTKGGNGEDGRQGYSGYDGKRGGNSGSFHLEAFNLSDIHLIDVQKTIGLGSKGGKGSFGGYGGKRGKNGRDKEGLCSDSLPRPKRGRKGERGRRGKTGENGIEGKVCLESLKEENQQVQTNKETTSIKVKNNQAKSEKIEIKCKEDVSIIMCHEVLIEDKTTQNLKQKENVICY